MDGDKKKVVFVVEDDLFLAKTYQITFQKEGCEVWVANDGKEAISLLEKDPPNVVVLDLMLPSVSGFDVLSAIKKSEKWKDVPVIILSNLGQAEDVERGKSMGAKEYIVKANAKVADVVATVKKYL